MSRKLVLDDTGLASVVAYSVIRTQETMNAEIVARAVESGIPYEAATDFGVHLDPDQVAHLVQTIGNEVMEKAAQDRGQKQTAPLLYGADGKTAVH